jgi:N-methylhydantoinase B
VVGLDGAERELNSKGAFTAPADCLIVLRAPGSGGFGPPADRDLAKLRDDVINEYVSPDAARSEYQGSAEQSLGCPACSPRPAS